jgi:hypothetical protein
MSRRLRGAPRFVVWGWRTGDVQIGSAEDRRIQATGCSNRSSASTSRSATP